MKSMVCLLIIFFQSVVTADEPPTDVLDGLTISGQIKASNVWLRISVNGVISFNAGQFSWSTDAGDGQGQSFPYHMEPSTECLLFTAWGAAEPGSDDEMYWQGCYDGGQLTDITARWTRVEKDIIHDLMLPEVVQFTFTTDEYGGS